MKTGQGRRLVLEGLALLAALFCLLGADQPGSDFDDRRRRISPSEPVTIQKGKEDLPTNPAGPRTKLLELEIRFNGKLERDLLASLSTKAKPDDVLFRAAAGCALKSSPGGKTLPKKVRCGRIRGQNCSYWCCTDPDIGTEDCELISCEAQ